MTTEVHVSREQVRHEILLKLQEDNEPKLRTEVVAEEVQAYWRDVAWPTAVGFHPGHPYETDGYRESIDIKRNRDDLGRYVAGWTIFSDHPNANFIEFGTGPDKPGSRSPWGPYTPTPEFAPAAKTELHFQVIEEAS